MESSLPPSAQGLAASINGTSLGYSLSSLASISYIHLRASTTSPPNVALDLSSGNSFSPVLGGISGPFSRIPSASSASPLHPRPGLILSSFLERERRESVKDVTLPSEVCSHSHPHWLLTVLIAVATVGSGGWYLFNGVALSSEVCFHPCLPLTVFVVVCRGF